jgi:bacterioferritin (cytochrome b1)
LNHRSNLNPSLSKEKIMTTSKPSHAFSRRQLVKAGAIAGFVGAFSLPQTAQATGKSRKVRNDIKVLNNALFYEYQAIWAYGVAAGKLSSSDVGKAVLAIGLANQADHKMHAQALDGIVRQLGGDPAMPQADYDLSSYIQRGEGNLDSDVNIAKLALALEVDAAIAYTKEVAQLKMPEYITAGASIGSDESAHAAVIRSAMVSLGLNLRPVGAAFLSDATRDAWIVKV